MQDGGVDTATNGSAHERFARDWEEALPSIVRYCRRNTPTPQDADDLVQTVALRTLRGYPRFRGDASFLGWALTIARREAARSGRARSTRSAREQPLSVDHVEPADGSGALVVSGIPLSIVDCAHAHGDLTDTEHAVLTARLWAADRSWDVIAADLGLKSNTCVVHHVRAVPKLRVHAAVGHADALGGRAEFAAALQRLRSRPGVMTDAQAEVFEDVVLRGVGNRGRRGWRTALRVAVGLVLREVGLVGVAGDAVDDGSHRNPSPPGTDVVSPHQEATAHVSPGGGFGGR